MCISIPGHDGPWPYSNPWINWKDIAHQLYYMDYAQWAALYLNETINDWAPCIASRCPLGLTARCMSPTDGQNRGCFSGVFANYEQHPQCTGTLEGWRG